MLERACSIAPIVPLDGRAPPVPIAPVYHRGVVSRKLRIQVSCDGCAQVCTWHPWIAEEVFPHRCGNTKSLIVSEFNPCNSPDFHSCPQEMCTRSTAFRPVCPQSYPQAGLCCGRGFHIVKQRPSISRCHPIGKPMSEAPITLKCGRQHSAGESRIGGHGVVDRAHRARRSRRRR